MTEIKLTGNYKTDSVFANGKKLNLKESLKHVSHSPSGFSWGYEGSGPKQLSFSILNTLFSEDVARNNYLDFMNEIISKLPYQKDFDVNISIDLKYNFLIKIE